MEKVEYSAQEAVEAIEKLLRKTHSIRVKPVDVASLEYVGPEITHFTILATDFSIKETLSHLDYSRDEHGQTYFESILIKLYQLGYQAGYINGFEGPNGFRSLMESLKPTQQP